MTGEAKLCGRKPGRTKNSDAIWHSNDGVTDHAPLFVPELCQ
jgi:hypothetical protein